MISSSAGGALFDGWEFRQFVVAAQWLRDHDIEIDHPTGSTIPDADALMRIKLTWDERFAYAPLTGPMQVYNPDVDWDLKMGVTVLWIHSQSGMSSRPAPKTASEIWSKHI